MALSGKDFRKIGLGSLIVIMVFGLFVFSSLSKSCSMQEAGRSGEAGRSDEVNDTREQTKTTSPGLTLVLEQVVATPTDEESITIKNTGEQPINLADWTLGDKNEPDARGLAGELQAGDSKIYDHRSLGFGINDSDEIIYLKYRGKLIDKWQGK